MTTMMSTETTTTCPSWCLGQHDLEDGETVHERALLNGRAGNVELCKIGDGPDAVMVTVNGVTAREVRKVAAAMITAANLLDGRGDCGC